MADQCFLVPGKTCCYGIVMKMSRCDVTNTYADLHRDEYTAYAIVCGVVGIAALVGCVHKLYSVHRCKGSPIQKQVYTLLIVASVTFIARAVDPMSYDFIYPPVVSGLISDVCTASLYSVLILSVAFWARIVIRPTDLESAEIPIRASTALGLFLTWFVFACVRPLYLLPTWDDDAAPERIYRSWHILIQYSMAPVLLFLISTLAVIFGIRIHRRLKSIREMHERSAAIASLREHALKANPTVVRSESADELPPRVLFTSSSSSMEDRFVLTRDSRILKVLVLMAILSAVVIVAQIYVLVDFVERGCMLQREYNCSSLQAPSQGKPTGGSVGDRVCELPFPFPMLPLTQILGIVVMYWSFRKTRPLTKEAVTEEIFLNPTNIQVDHGAARTTSALSLVSSASGRFV
ncbi:hypothetical protein H310_08385 [Aphanomyces invadans]|uniref:Uncharacterized protein n=1 Tax=Aphanomyces invadans TaxID=157072 RepID=A0A024TZZ9_9STRA|nr:hypothetical protein H310_08385 [Aphanomyces invadans]ETV98892.1 hypothetical protein H310_08385 [Aphanomyces invadans]|eukprot:XP_008872320.1 hypothetical protein H310_08385 [Aphanomyces invadans]